MGSGSTMLHQILWRRSRDCHLMVEDFRHESSAVIQSFVKSLYTGHIDVASENVESLKSLYRLAKLEKFVDVIDNFLTYYNITKCSPELKHSAEVGENHVAHSSGGLVASNTEVANHAIHSTVGISPADFCENDAINSTVGMSSINSEIGNNKLARNAKKDRKNIEDQLQGNYDKNNPSLQLVESMQCFKIARSPDVWSSTATEDVIQQGNVRVRAEMILLDADASDAYSSPGNELLVNDCQPEKHKEVSTASSKVSNISEVKRENKDDDYVFLKENLLLLEAKTQEEVKKSVGRMGTKRKNSKNAEIQEIFNLNDKKESTTQSRRKQGDIDIPCKLKKTSYLPDHQNELLTESVSGSCSKISREQMTSEIVENDKLFDPMKRKVKVEVTRPAWDEIEKRVESTSLSKEEEMACQTSCSTSSSPACDEIEKDIETTSLTREEEEGACQTSLEVKPIAVKTTKKNTLSSSKRLTVTKENCEGLEIMQKDEFTSVGRLAKGKVDKTDVKGNSRTLKKNETSAGDNTMELSSDNPILQAIYNKSKMLCPVWVKRKHYTKICGHCDKLETDCQCPPVPKERQHKCKSCPRTFRDHTSRTYHMQRDHAFSCTHCDYCHHKLRLIANHLYMKHGLILDEKKYPVLKCEAQVRKHAF